MEYVKAAIYFFSNRKSDNYHQNCTFVKLTKTQINTFFFNTIYVLYKKEIKM